MRVRGLPRSLASIILTFLFAKPIFAALLPDLLQSFEDLQDVRKRCSNPCGYYGQLCCESGEVCYTDANNQAQCGVGNAVTTAAPGQQIQVVTTTFVETNEQTVTRTYTNTIAVATATCQYSLGQTPCGSMCCLAGQYCQSNNNCVAVGGGSSGYYSSLFTVTTIITNTASAPIRPTSNTLVTVTTGSATTVVPYITPVSTDGSIIVGHQDSSGGGLSGGAIAGIVIGVIIGIILLILFCACCLFKGLIDGLLAIFGLGPRRKRVTEEEVYERRSHRDNRGRRTWFGTRPGRTDVVEEKRKSSGWGTAGWLAGGLAALALFLGLKRKNRRDDKSSTGYGSSYYSDYTSESSSSDRRTRRSSRSRSRR
jgi:hypothetical protein